MSDWLRQRSFLYWYWSGLLHGRFRLWQILGLGTAWIAVGVGLHVFLRAKTGTGSSTMLAVLCACGVFHFVLAAKAIGLQRRLDPDTETDDSNPGPGAAKRRGRASRAEPPRSTPAVETAGDRTPFRDAPRPPPIAVVDLGAATASTPSALAPIADNGDPDDKPTLLT